MKRAAMLLNEKFIERLFLTDIETGKPKPDPALEALSLAMRAAREATERISALSDALDADSTLTASARALRVREQAIKIGETVAGRIDAAKAAAEKDAASVDLATSMPLPPKDAMGLQLESELRAVVRAMKESDRRKLLMGTISDELAGAILRGNPMLSSISATERGAFRERWRRHRHPAEFDRLARLAKAIDHCERATTEFVSYVKVVIEAPEAQRAAAGKARVKSLEAADDAA